MSVRKEILALLEEKGQLTQKQIYEALPLTDTVSIRGRLSELVNGKNLARRVEKGVPMYSLNPDICPLCYEPRDNGKTHGSWCK